MKSALEEAPQLNSPNFFRPWGQALSWTLTELRDAPEIDCAATKRKVWDEISNDACNEMKLAVAPALLGKGATSNFSNVTKMSEIFPRAVAANFLFFSPPMAGFLFNNCNLRDRGRMQFCILPRKSPLLSKKLKRSLTFYQLLDVSAAQRAPFWVGLHLLIVLGDIYKLKVLISRHFKDILPR